MIIMCLKQKGKQSAADLAQYLEVSKRTIYRDVDALSQMNVPITTFEGLNGGYEINPSYFMPSVRLSEREVLILMLLLKVSGQLNLPEFRESIHILNAKLENTYQDAAKQFEKSLKHVQFDIQNIFPQSYLNGSFEAILHAFHQYVRMEIEYFSPLKNKTITREISPLELYYSEGGWYLDAYCHLRQKKRTFRLDRIKQIKLLDKKKDKQLEHLYKNQALNDEMSLVVFDIQKELFHLIQYDSPLRHAEITSENETEYRVQVNADRLVFFETLAIRNSDQVTILKPDSLVSQLEKKLSQALKKYQ